MSTDTRPNVTLTAPRAAAEFGFLVSGFPIAIASFVLLVTGLSLATGMAVVWIGVPLGIAVLALARQFARLERGRLGSVGMWVADPEAPTRGRGRGGWLRTLLDPQSWRDLLHGILVLPLSIVTFSVAVTWVAGAVGGLTYWFWSPLLPPASPGDRTLPQLLHLPFSDSVLYLVLGAVLAATVVPVLRRCTAAHAALATALLGGRRA